MSIVFILYYFKECLAIFKKAVATQPEGNLKDQEDGAVACLEQTFNGEPQLEGGGSTSESIRSCFLSI